MILHFFFNFFKCPIYLQTKWSDSGQGINQNLMNTSRGYYTPQDLWLVVISDIHVNQMSLIILKMETIYVSFYVIENL